jgi:hypothetical protein
MYLFIVMQINYFMNFYINIEYLGINTDFYGFKKLQEIIFLR